MDREKLERLTHSLRFSLFNFTPDQTCFLQALLGRNLQHLTGLSRSELPCSTAAIIAGYGETERVLILHEIETGIGEQQTLEEACMADVACLLYDTTDPDSFKYVADIFLVLLMLLSHARLTRYPLLELLPRHEDPLLVYSGEGRSNGSCAILHFGSRRIHCQISARVSGNVYMPH